MTLADLDVLF